MYTTHHVRCNCIEVGMDEFMEPYMHVAAKELDVACPTHDISHGAELVSAEVKAQVRLANRCLMNNFLASQ